MLDGVTLHDDRALLRVLLRGEMGAGEGFVAGEWDAADLVGLIRGFLRATAARGVESWLTGAARLPDLLRHRRRGNDRAGSRRNIHAHDDLGNRFYQRFLDDELSYSCAIWQPGDDLAAAQRRKLDRVCELAGLAPGDHVLEIGCGLTRCCRSRCSKRLATSSCPATSARSEACSAPADAR